MDVKTIFELGAFNSIWFGLYGAYVGFCEGIEHKKPYTYMLKGFSKGATWFMLMFHEIHTALRIGLPLRIVRLYHWFGSKFHL